MKFSAREDIDAPIDVVFDHVRDFDGFERRMLRRGIDVRRDERVPQGEVGSRWMARTDFRGKPHNVEAELVSLEHDQGYAVELTSSGVRGLAVVDLVALSKSRTRLFVSLELRAETFGARMMMQPLKLARGRLEKGFEDRVASFARGISVA